MGIIYRYYVGNAGPQLFESKDGELPFRVEIATEERQFEGQIQNVALFVQSGVAGSAGNSIAGSISAADYSAFRAAHFNAFNIAGDLL